jgi:hypothetical protein
MGRRKPKKPRRGGSERGRFHIDDQAVGMGEILAHAAELGDTVDDPGRLLYVDDPALGMGKVATGIDPDTGQLVTSETEDPFPVALFEPARAMLTQQPGQAPAEGQVEAAIMLGLRRIPRGIFDLRTCPGWALLRLADDRVELRSPDGGVYSRITPTAPDPGWFSAAIHHRYVICYYGPQLGVRLPPDRTPDQYSPADRLEEFREARGRGWVAGGIIPFHNNR